MKPDGDFIYPSYVEDIMGDIFSLGFGPFRWVCTSGSEADLATTDRLAAEVTASCAAAAPEISKQQFEDNLLWILQADSHKMVVGSQSRILYSNAEGRAAIALAFNEAVADGRISAPVVLSRDHHDVSGTDSPYRETSNIRDGSSFCADMAVHNFVGDSFRGATYVARSLRLDDCLRQATPTILIGSSRARTGGWHCTTVAERDGARPSTAASAWCSMALLKPASARPRCCSGMS